MFPLILRYWVFKIIIYSFTTPVTKRSIPRARISAITARKYLYLLDDVCTIIICQACTSLNIHMCPSFQVPTQSSEIQETQSSAEIQEGQYVDVYLYGKNGRQSFRGIVSYITELIIKVVFFSCTK